MHQRRNGITLLFVVSMIVLFLLMGTTFVVVSNDFLRSARKRSVKSVESISQNHVEVLERAFYDLIREPSLADSNSPLRGHSLLGDMYGYGFTADVKSATANNSKHFITLTLDFAGSGRSIIDGAKYQPTPVPALAGLVLSFTSGPATGMSTRIVDHQVSGDATTGYTHTFVVLPEWMDNAFNIADASKLIGQRVLVNGRPFSGTGAGNFDPQAGLNQPALSGSALLPNQRGRSQPELLGVSGSGYLSQGNATLGRKANSGATNESYDTFDEQNMFLAGIRPNGTAVKPSFHRNELISAGGGNPKADFRAFTGGGPAGDGVIVDNDNNGIVDGIWMDIGLPGQSLGDGTHYKPLVSYLVVDLDGRLNLNAHGNPLAVDRKMTEIDLLGLPASAGLHRGQGYGPPEISVLPLLSGASAGIVGSRYGPDGKPGEPDVRDGWSSYKLYGYPDQSVSASIPGTVDRDFGSAMDLHGRFAIGYPNNLRDVADANFPIGLPVANISTSSLASEAVDSAYEMTFADGTMAGPFHRGWDDPYSPRDLEAVLRQSDPDSSFLSSRLIDLGQGVFSSGTGANHSVTTSSFEVPTTFENLPEKLARILESSGMVGTEIRNQVLRMLPPEVLRGLPMNVNRPFGDGIDNNGNGVVDEIGEVGTLTHPSGEVLDFDEDNDGTSSGDADSYLARANFARHLYVVTLLATERVDRDGDGVVNANDWFDFNDDGTTDDQDRIDYRKMIAQWAMNTVDFRDRDAINTPFEVDLNPWNGWDVDGDVDLSASEKSLGDERAVFWGAERPELLITETFASHDRRTQNLEIDSSKERIAPDGNDDDFDSHLVPNVSAFFELYNPWVINDANQSRPTELYDAGLNGVDLQKKSLDGTSPVWRLTVTGHDESDLDPDDETNNVQVAGVHKAVSSVRRVYFTQPAATVDSGPEVYFPDSTFSASAVPPGVYAIVGSAGVKDGDHHTTYFGRRLTPDAINELDQTRRIVLDPKNGEVEIGFWNFADSKMDVEKRSVITIPIGRTDGGLPRNLGVSDPLNGYSGLTGDGMDITLTAVEDGQKFTEDTTAAGTDYAFDEPVDKKIDPDHYDDFLVNDGLRSAYRTVHLQRLANPMLRFNADSNPYLTVDSSSVDLFVFNGAETVEDPLNTPGAMRFGTFERRSATDASGDPATHGQDETKGRQRLLFKNDRQGHQVPFEDDSPEIPTDEHIFHRNLAESFGGLNWAFRDAKDTGQKPFAWLMWNNRPFVSPLELAGVPFPSSYWLTRLFNVADDSRDVYQPPREEDTETEARNHTAQYPHLLNFYADKLEGGQAGPSLHRVFDYLEVPSRFVGTESYVNPQTFAGNRHGLTFGLAPPFDTISNYRYPGKLNINTVLDEKVWIGLMQLYADPVGGVDFKTWVKSRNGSAPGFYFANPYRSPLASHWVPPTAGKIVEPVECGLFRSEPGAADQPLFDYDPAVKEAYNDGDRAAFFRYDMRQRLGNLVTSRSSVFAIWITVGYFETDASGRVKTVADGFGRTQGFEIGRDSGEVRRNRGFYLFDRSIPVAFEPGKNHNVDRAVLVRSVIE